MPADYIFRNQERVRFLLSLFLFLYLYREVLSLVCDSICARIRNVSRILRGRFHANLNCVLSVAAQLVWILWPASLCESGTTL